MKQRLLLCVQEGPGDVTLVQVGGSEAARAADSQWGMPCFKGDYSCNAQRIAE